MFLKNKFIYLLLGGLVLLQGCVALQSFPTVARAGDTIALSVGSPGGMTKTNTTATYVTEQGILVDLPIRAIIRLRPDQTSATALFDFIVDAEDSYTGHSQWLSVIVIDLPPPSVLPVGLGHINIISSASYGEITNGINDIPIDLEIIAGTGTPNYFKYDNGFGVTSVGDLSDLEALPQVVIQPPDVDVDEDVNFAAAEIKVNVPTIETSTGSSTPLHAIRVVADDFYTKNSSDQVQMNWSKNGDEFTINFISPQAKMEAVQLRFSIVLKPGYVFLQDPLAHLVSVNIYDINGNLTALDQTVPDRDLFTVKYEVDDTYWQ